MLEKLYITPKQWLRILRWSLYALVFLSALLLQTAVLGKYSLLGGHGNLVAVVICCVCLREKAERGGTFALLASLFWCLSGVDYGPLHIAVFTIVPVFGSLLCQAFLSARFLPALVITLFTLLLDQCLVFGLKLLFDQASLLLFLRQLFPCIVLSLLAFPLIYVTVKAIETIGDAYES